MLVQARKRSSLVLGGWEEEWLILPSTFMTADLPAFVAGSTSAFVSFINEQIVGGCGGERSIGDEVLVC